MAREVTVKGPHAVFIWIAIILLSIAGAAAAWGVLWRAWGWAF